MARTALYHLLDPFWTRVPPLGTVGVRVDEMAGVIRIRLARRYLGRELMPVYCYAVGDMLVDSGMLAAARQMLDLVEQRGLRRASSPITTKTTPATPRPWLPPASTSWRRR